MKKNKKKQNQAKKKQNQQIKKQIQIEKQKPIENPEPTRPAAKPGEKSAQATRNQINARKSTGPRTEKGKAVSSQNAWRHGMRSSRVVLATEDPAEFDALRESLRRSHRPVGHDEEVLVDRIAVAEWKRGRYETIEADIFSLLFTAGLEEMGLDHETCQAQLNVSPAMVWAIKTGPEKALDLVTRYRGTMDREYHRSVSQLRQTQRRREQLAREAAEAEAIVRVQAGTAAGMSVKDLATVLLVARRDTILQALRRDPIGPRISGAEMVELASFGRPNEWPSPLHVASFGLLDESALSEVAA